MVAVIAAYNEENTIADIALRTKKVLEKYGDYTILVVDDGSNDRTYERLLGLRSDIPDPKMKIIRHRENRGYGAALFSGLSFAIKEDPYCVLTLDGDGQHRPEEFDERFLKILGEDKADLIVAKPIGVRYEEYHVLKDIWRKNLAHLFNLFNRFGKIEYIAGGMRIFNRKALETIKLPFYINKSSPSELISLQAIIRGLRIAEVPTIYDERKNGKSFTSPSYPIRNIPMIGLNILAEVLRQIF